MFEAKDKSEEVIDMRVGIYARVSTTDHGQDPSMQLIPLREFVTAQGWTFAGEYTDYASATDLQGRRALARAVGPGVP